MANYLTKFKGNLFLKEVLHATPLVIEEWPVLGQYVDRQGRNALCVTHLLTGKCRQWMDGKCKFAHIANPQEIPQQYAQQCCELIRPGVGYVYDNKLFEPSPDRAGSKRRRSG